MKRGNPGGSAVRKGPSVGPDYPNEKFHNPWNGSDIDKEFGSETEKTLCGPTDTPGAMGIGPLHPGKNYDELWEGK